MGNIETGAAAAPVGIVADGTDVELPDEALDATDEADSSPEQTDNSLDQPDAPQDGEPVEGSVTDGR